MPRQLATSTNHDRVEHVARPQWQRKLPLGGYHAMLDFSGRSGREHAELAIHGGADRRDLEGGRRGGPDGRLATLLQHQPSDLLRMALKVRRDDVPEPRRMKELENENAKLKRMYAELALENAA